MKTYLFLFLFCMPTIRSLLYSQIPPPIIYKNSEVENTEAYIKGSIYQKDFLLFKNLLSTTHPAFSAEISYPIHIDSLISDKFYTQLSNCKSPAEFNLLIRSITASLHDGHTFAGSLSFNNKAFYPMNIKVLNGEFCLYVTEKKHEYYLGELIESVNGVPINQVVADFGKYISHDNSTELSIRAVEYLLLPENWDNIPYRMQDTTLLIKFQSGNSVQMEPMLRKDMDLCVWSVPQTQRITSPQNKAFFYTKYNSSICYFQFNSCFDYNSIKYQIEMSTTDEVQRNKMLEELESKKDIYPKFDDFLLELFSKIKEDNISTLVIDLRNNGGGNSALCKQLMSYLIAAEDIKDIKSFVRISEFMKLHYSELYQKIEDGLAQQNKELIVGKLYPAKELPVEEHDEDIFPLNEDKSLLFNGNIIFIQSKNTYSSAGDLITLARDNQVGIVIGEKSSYRPCNYGDLLTWSLPNTDRKSVV